MKEVIYSDMNILLKEIRQYLKYGGVENFDLDEDFKIILKKYNIDSSFGALGHIYSFLDVVCDAKRHFKRDVDEGYSFDEAITDLENVIQLIDQKVFETLESKGTLMEKFKSI